MPLTVETTKTTDVSTVTAAPMVDDHLSTTMSTDSKQSLDQSRATNVTGLLADPGLWAPQGPGDKKRESFPGVSDSRTGKGAPGDSSIEIADATDVVRRSNVAAANGGDPFWDSVNGDSDKLTLPSGRKPDEWSRGIILVEETQPDGTSKKVPKMVGSGAKDVVTKVGKDGTKRSVDGDAKMAADLDLGDMKAYRNRLIADFDFGGVIAFYLEKGGSARRAFLNDMLAKYAPETEPDDPKQLKILALSEELWSYATRGADSTGNTDIAQMQGILFAIDSEIVKTSNSNTRMSKETFTLPDTDITIPIGDGVHGRATTLTTRHLLGVVEGGNDELEGYDENLAFIDISGSMASEMSQLGGLMGAGNVSGEVDLITYHDSGFSAQYTTPPSNKTTTKERAEHRALFEDYKETMVAYQVVVDALKDANTTANQELKITRGKDLKAARSAFMSFHDSLTGRTPSEAAKVLAEAGEDTSTDEAFDATKSAKSIHEGKVSMRESGIDVVIAHLIDRPTPETMPKKPFNKQILMMTDEQDAKPNKMKFLKRMADKHGYTVRILFSLQVGGLAKTFQIIELDEIDLSDISKYKVSASNGKECFDWSIAATEQKAEVKKWSDYTRS
ncbi:MAG: hypothetical protein P8R54_24315 [Myxococcota bacterium]|nr:hypothetical protein [Myxococcota bacterium]